MYTDDIKTTVIYIYSKQLYRRNRFLQYVL